MNLRNVMSTGACLIVPALLALADAGSLAGAAMESGNGGGQDARATVVRASCPEPSVATPCAISTALAAPVGAAAVGQLEKDFITPPDAAKPTCFWMWLNNLTDKQSITRDLEEFKAKGMGGAMIVPVTCDNMPLGPAFLTPEWRELFKHALQEAHRLGLEITANLSGGWCMGGPWITPENSGRWFLQSELKVVGPQRFSAALPLPGPKDGYDSPPQFQVIEGLKLPFEKVDFRDTAVVAFREPERARLGEARAKDLPAKSNRIDGYCTQVPQRVVMDQTLTPWLALPDDQPIAPQDVIDLTAKLGPGGKLDWDVPAGTWTIIRTGHRMTGAQVVMGGPGAAGLEVDWLSKAAVDLHWDKLVKILLADAGPLAGTTLKYLSSDSFEDGYPNWTGKMLEEFKRYRGYDATPYLPVLAGRLVGSAAISERFLHDYRKTVADCVADNNYGYLAKLAQAHGMDIICEAGGPAWSATMCMDALKNLGRCFSPQGEFWIGQAQNYVGKQTSSAAHIYGRKKVSAEAFTAAPTLTAQPALMKPIGDRAFCEGTNRFVFCHMHSSRAQDGLPGYVWSTAGTYFSPNITWWQQAAGPWLSYVNRCQALLQSGLFAADVLYYNGDWAPNLVEPKHVDPALGNGYDYDVCNAEVLLTRLAVKDGRIVLPDGMSYRLLVLPDSKRMPVEVVRKLRELVKAGATVVGPKPQSDPGLLNFPQCDEEVTKIAAEVWGSCDGQGIKQQTFGSGRIWWNQPLREILLGDGVPPDFEYSKAGAFIDFIHRTTAEGEVYFLANRNNQAESLDCTFRVAGKQPELWNPVSGDRRDLPVFAQKDGRISVPLEFEPNGSMFVVFRKNCAAAVAGSPQPATTNFPKLTPARELTGPWVVQFDPQWFYPVAGLSGDAARGSITFDKLDDWLARPEEAVRSFSGTAVYRKTFDLAGQATMQNPQSTIFLDLGTVRETARVRLNGVDLGVVWCHPWRVDITKAVKPGANALEIEVVNLWPNRLSGDAKLPAEQRRTRTNSAPGAPQSSGLLGPVRLLTAD